MNEKVATYYYKDRTFHIYAYYHTDMDYNSGRPNFYHIHDSNNQCLTERGPWYSFPRWGQVKNVYI